MKVFQRLNPNILLTSGCNQSCSFCFAKNEMKLAEKKEMKLDDLRRLVAFLKKEGMDEIKLMGGEPTLHSRFKEIIDHILSQNLKIRLFTNGLFSRELADWLSEKEIKAIEYVVNLTTPAFGSESERKRIGDNLDILKKFNFIASVTLDKLDFKSEPLTKFIEEYQIKSVRLGIANNLIGASSWLKTERYKDFGSVICSLAVKLKETGVRRVSLNCGFMADMFQSEQIDFLKRELRVRGWGCEGKAATFDVGTDLSIFPCFVLGEFRAKNIFDFKDLKTADKFLKDLVFWTQGSLFSLIGHKKRLSFKHAQCQGPCLSAAINNAENGRGHESFANFQKSGHFKLIYHSLYIFRNL